MGLDISVEETPRVHRLSGYHLISIITIMHRVRARRRIINPLPAWRPKKGGMESVTAKGRRGGGGRFHVTGAARACVSCVRGHVFHVLRAHVFHVLRAQLTTLS